jgi:transglutaminase-like putative cysteine protease
VKTLLKWALGLCLVSSTCCLWALVWANWEGLGLGGGTAHREAPALAPTTDLGVVLLPPRTPPDAARHYDWRAESLRPADYKLGFGLSASLAQHYALGLKDYAAGLHYRPLAQDRFSFRAPPGCERLPMACVYAELMRSNAPPVHALGERFVARVRSQRLSAPQAAELIVSFVQGIRYDVPHEQPFGVLPPALVPAQDRGDCDSKALLAAMLLRQVGIDAVVLSSERLGHAALGVGLPGPGTHFELDGRRYRYAEVTAAGWPIGMMPPKYDLPRLWTVIPVAHDVSPLGPQVGESEQDAADRLAP